MITCVVVIVPALLVAVNVTMYASAVVNVYDNGLPTPMGTPFALQLYVTFVPLVSVAVKNVATLTVGVGDVVKLKPVIDTSANSS